MRSCLIFSLAGMVARLSLPCLLLTHALYSSYAASNLYLLESKKINFVLTIMSKDLPEEVRNQFIAKGIPHKFVKKEDVDYENLLETFGELCEVIEGNLRGDAEQPGKRVLVHCAMGISRSVTTVLAYGESIISTPDGTPSRRDRETL